MPSLTEHPNAVLVRERFAALAEGDPAPFYDAVREDFHNVNDIGAGPWHEHHGRASGVHPYAQSATARAASERARIRRSRAA